VKAEICLIAVQNKFNQNDFVILLNNRQTAFANTLKEISNSNQTVAKLLELKRSDTNYKICLIAFKLSLLFTDLKTDEIS
jgi:hypothetical protein